MIANKSKLTIKLFIAVWIILALNILLKITFNYWQPYIIPNNTLQIISNFIDNNIIVKMILNKFFWMIGTSFMILASIQEWKFNKKYLIILLICAVISAVDDFTPLDSIIDTIIMLFTLIGIPLIINKKKWLTTILTFVFSYVFLFLSLWLNGFSKTDDMPYLIAILFNNDYYIMLIFNYFLFNFFKKRRDKYG